VTTGISKLPGKRSLDGELPVDTTLRRVAVIFRMLGWAWMFMLGIVTLVSDKDASPAVVVGTMVLVSLWTAGTLLAARTHRTLSSNWYVIVDGVVAMIVLLSSTAAGADDFFHGGYPMSWLGVAAYAWGFRGAIAGSVVLAVEQAFVEFFADKPAVPIAGSVTFIVFAAVAGWGFSALRDADGERLKAQEKLATEQRERARIEERAELADRLHDSVLQTLIAIRREAGDERQVRYLARRQERELRATIDQYRSPFEQSLRAALLAHCGEVEDLYRVEVDAVIRGDASSEGEFAAVAPAAREALINAAKHSGRIDIDLYAELSPDCVEVFVRDRGVGFSVPIERADGGLTNSLIRRIREAGGSAAIDSRPGEGTRVEIKMGCDE
jgi:signal transduction histidine kinase